MIIRIVLNPEPDSTLWMDVIKIVLMIMIIRIVLMDVIKKRRLN